MSSILFSTCFTYLASYLFLLSFSLLSVNLSSFFLLCVSNFCFVLSSLFIIFSIWSPFFSSRACSIFIVFLSFLFYVIGFWLLCSFWYQPHDSVSSTSQSFSFVSYVIFFVPFLLLFESYWVFSLLFICYEFLVFCFHRLVIFCLLFAWAFLSCHAYFSFLSA